MSPIRYSDQGYSWSAGEPEECRTLLAILESWRGTPYLSGAQRKQGGADCVRFVCGVLDEFYGVERTPSSPVPDDVQFHDRRRATRAVAWMRRAYPSYRVRGTVLQPTDVVVVGPKLGGPGHVMLAGPRYNTLWHCNRGVGVVEAGLAFEQESQVVKAIYRLHTIRENAA